MNYDLISTSSAFRQRDRLNCEFDYTTWTNVQHGGPHESDDSKFQFHVDRHEDHRKIETNLRLRHSWNVVQWAQLDGPWLLLGQIRIDGRQPQFEADTKIAEFRQRRSAELQAVPKLQRHPS